MDDNGTVRDAFAFTPRGLGRLTKSRAVILAFALLLAAAYFGSSRGFGHFLLSIPALPILLIFALNASLMASARRGQRKRAAVAWTLIAISPVVYFSSYDVLQHIKFLTWAPLHSSLVTKALRKDGVIRPWDAWGFAGEDTTSYLVIDEQDRLGSKLRADEWTKEVGQSCGIAHSDRMWPKIYLVTTYTDCPFD